MAEINARTLMFNLGREDAIVSTTSAKIARYTERKQLAYKLTDEGVLLLDGRGKKIHLKNGVVTLRNALGLHALPERIMTNVMREDVSLQGQRCRAIDSIGDNIVLTTDPNLTKQGGGFVCVRGVVGVGVVCVCVFGVGVDLLGGCFCEMLGGWDG